MMSYQPPPRRNVVSFMKIVMKIVSHENISKSKFKMFRGDESFPLNIFLNKYYPWINFQIVVTRHHMCDGRKLISWHNPSIGKSLFLMQISAQQSAVGMCLRYGSGMKLNWTILGGSRRCGKWQTVSLEDWRKFWFTRFCSLIKSVLKLSWKLQWTKFGKN